MTSPDSPEHPEPALAGKKVPLLASFTSGLSTWVSIGTALISLAISLYTFAVTTDDPEVLLVMPEVVRIAQGGELGPYLYLQPIFIGTGMSDRIEVITAVRVQVEPLDAPGGRAEFVWDEQGAWMFDAATQSLNWVFTGDPGAFVVSAKVARDFTGLFIGPAEWQFGPGAYRITLAADRVAALRPLTAAIEIDVAQADVDFLNQSAGTRFLTFPARQAGRLRD